MPDRRPWPSSAPPAAAVSIAVQRARALRATSSPELRAMLTGLRLAHAACIDLAEETYEIADARTGADRAEALARAAAVKVAAQRIGALFDAAANATGEKPSRKGLRALLTRLTGGANA